MSQTLRTRPLTLPTGRAGRLLALGLLLVLLLVLWEAVGGPLVGLYEQRAERIDADRDRLARMDALGARLPALRRQLNGAAARTGPVALIDGATDAIASAALQEQVQAMASSLGATLSSSETVSGSAARDDAVGASGNRRAPSHAGNFRRIGVRISVTASFEVMAKLLARIEANSPTLLVDDLQLHGSRIQLGSNPPLEASLTVLAFRHADGRGGAAQDAGIPDGNAADPNGDAPPGGDADAGGGS